MNATNELRILGAAGDVKVTWDKDDPASRTQAREEVARLKTAGYLFFLVDGNPADEVTAGGGELVARIATAEEIVPEPVETEPSDPDAKYPTTYDDSPPSEPKKRGRKPGVPNKVKAIAVPPLRGG